MIAAIAAGYYVFSQSPSYRSTAVVQLDQSQSQQGNSSSTGPNLQLVTSNKVTAAAAKSLGRTDTATLAGEIDATYLDSENVVDIQATTPTAADAPAVANAFATAYMSELASQSAATLAALKAQETTLVNQINTLTAQNPAPSQLVQTQLAGLESLYQTVYSQVTALSVAAAPATLLQQATTGTSTAPSKLQIIGLGALIGLIAGAGVSLIREPFDTRIRDFADAERTSGRPTLAQLPFSRQFRGHAPLPVVTQPRTPFAESIRELRTSVQVLLGASKVPVIVVTSPAPFDGKTLVTANLAASYALSGKITILLSGDLRRPRIHDFFGGNETDRGLAELLDGSPPTRDDVAGYLHETPIEGLYLLPPGFPTGDPADALASPAMARTLDHLRALADIVVIDAPPVLAAADASITAAHADGVILVVRAGKTQRPALAETMKRLLSARVTVLGLAFNRVKNITGSAYRDHYLSASRLSTAGEDVPEPGVAAPGIGPGLAPGSSDAERANDSADDLPDRAADRDEPVDEAITPVAPPGAVKPVEGTAAIERNGSSNGARLNGSPVNGDAERAATARSLSQQ